MSDLGASFRKMEQALDLKKTFYLLGGSFAALLLLTFLLRFDNLLTYLFGFLLATVFSVVIRAMVCICSIGRFTSSFPN